MHKLKTLYLFGGQKSIWGHRGQILIFIKNALPLYVTKYIHVIHTLASHLRDKQANWGQSGVDVSKPAGYAVCDGNMSSSFFLSGNTSFSHTSLHLILTKLAQSDRYLDHYSGTDNGGVRGHDGVTGVKKVIFIKKASSPTEYLALTRDLCICSSLTPSTKVMVLKNCQGSFGVTGVKSSFSQKRHQVLQIM